LPYLRSFLVSLFTPALHEVEILFPACSMVLYTGMAKTFYDFFKDESQRNEFYGKVVENAHTSHIPSTKVWESFRLLKDGLKWCCSDWLSTSCPLLISVDEAHLYIQGAEEVGSRFTLYSCLIYVSYSSPQQSVSPKSPT